MIIIKFILKKDSGCTYIQFRVICISQTAICNFFDISNADLEWLFAGFIAPPRLKDTLTVTVFEIIGNLKSKEIRICLRSFLFESLDISVDKPHAKIIRYCDRMKLFDERSSFFFWQIIKVKSDKHTHIRYLWDSFPSCTVCAAEITEAEIIK